MIGSGLRSGPGSGVVLSADHFHAARRKIANSAPVRWWERARNAWLRDPIEIEILPGEDWHARVRVGRSRRLGGMDDLRRRWRLWAPFTSVTISVPVRHCLVRVIQLPKAAIARADAILQVDLERTTPFRDDVLAGWYRPPQESGGEQVLLNHIILKKDLIAPLIEDIRATRLPIKAIFPIDDDGNRLPANLLPAAERSGASAMTGLRWLAVACFAALYLFTMAAIWLTISGLDTALATVDRDVAQATEQAHEITRIATEADALAAQLSQPRLSKIAATPVTAVWEEVTRLLPDSTWLTSLRFEEGTVQIDGNSSNASGLIPLLAASPLFQNVTFASPVTRDPQKGTERFQIKILVAKHGEAKADQTQAVPK
jgi:general secretion pathway protein L